MPQPWTNLSAKFQDVIDLLTAQNAKLDALQQTLDYGLLTQATPPAPRIPYLLQVRVMLEEVKAALVGTGTDPTDIRAAIWGLAGPAPGTTLTDLYQILEDYKDSFGDRGAGMTLYNMLDSMYVTTTGLLQDTDAINAAIGGVPHNSLEIASVRGLLNALRLCACEGNTGPPLTGDDAICSNPYRSIGMVVVPWSLIGGTSVVFAVFPDPPPSGLAFGSTFGIGEDYAELESADWSAWRVWIASEAAQFAVDSGVSRYNTNQWIRLSGSGSRSFSVAAQYALTVVLCRYMYTFVGCTTFTSQLVNYNSTPYQAIRWPDTMEQYHSPPDPAWSQPVYLQVSAQTVYIRASRPELLIWNNSNEIYTTGDWQEVALADGALSINDQTESTGTFTVEICDTPQT